MLQRILAKIMDFDPRITSDGSGYGVHHGWGCNFNFGYGYDIIDEDTETEKCRVQALQFLIAKADAEIRDLEDELAILQCQLKWAESDEQRDPYEVCCSTFKQKINFLSSSIQSLDGGNILGGHTTDEILKIQRPPERIFDIINALINHKFSLPDEQVLLDGKNLLANLGSPNNDMDLMQQAADFESSMESEEPMPVIERQPVHTVSEESNSDAVRHSSKDSKEERDVGKSDVEVVARAPLDADRCTSEQRSGLLTLKPVLTPTQFQAFGEGNPMPDALGRGGSKECLTGSKIDENQLTTLSVKIEPLVKFEDDYDMNIQPVALDFPPKMQDPEIEDPVEDHPKETENQLQNLVNTPITYNRRKLSLKSTFKGKKVQRKNRSDLSCVEPCSPSLTLKALRKTGKKESRSNAKGSGKLCLPSTREERVLPLPESNWQRKLKINEDKAHANTSRVSGAKGRQIHGASRESSSIESPEMKVSNTTEEAFCAQSLNGRHMFLRSPDLVEVKGSVATADFANDQGVPIAEDPINDLEILRLKLFEDPDFLSKLKVSELKAIMKQNKMRGSYKLKKEKIVEELTKRLCL